MLLSIPMVGIYMPLYDVLHAQLRPEFGAYAPALAGMAARAVAVVAVAPLELIRTRQQAGGAISSASFSSPPSTVSPPSWHRYWGSAIPSTASSVSGCPHPAPSGPAPMLKALLRGVLQPASGVARKWTGVGATLARDVPFTALYWCAVEPIRAHLLSSVSSPPRKLALHGLSSCAAGTLALRLGRDNGAAAGSPASSAAASAEQTRPVLSASVAAASNEVPAGLIGGSSSGSVTPASRHHQHDPTSTSRVASSGISCEEPAGHPTTPSTSRVLWANLVAGGVSGALAAAITTPFDVVKTRLQTRSSSSSSATSDAAVAPRGNAATRLPHHRSERASACRGGGSVGATFATPASTSSSPASAALPDWHCAVRVPPPLGTASGTTNATTTLGMLRAIWRAEGISGLFAGVGPRAARAAPACAIVIATYEVLKTAL